VQKKGENHKTDNNRKYKEKEGLKAVARSKSEAGLPKRLKKSTKDISVNPKQIESPYRNISSIVPAPAPYHDLPKDHTHLKSIDEIVSVDDPFKIYVNMKKIGEGTFGEVYVGLDIRTLEKVAVKKNEYS